MAKFNKKQVAAALAILPVIVAAGENGCMQPAEVFGPLAQEGFVETNAAGADANGHQPTRATQKGIEEVSKNQTQSQANGAADAAATAKPAFAIEDGVALPAVSGRGRTATTYPFDLLAVGQSFFVPNSAERENAAKSMASTVSSATARYAVEVPGETVVNRKGKTVPKMDEQRKFVVRAVEGGARIWRTK